MLSLNICRVGSEACFHVDNSERPRQCLGMYSKIFVFALESLKVQVLIHEEGHPRHACDDDDDPQPRAPCAIS